LVVVYALSGIALNRLDDWNPSYEVTREEVAWGGEIPDRDVSREAVVEFLDRCGERDGYKKHYRPAPETLKIFVHGGNVVLDTRTGRGVLEKLRRRPSSSRSTSCTTTPGACGRGSPTSSAAP
jgi:hypothetical protein